MSIISLNDARIFPAFLNLDVDTLTQILESAETYVKNLTERTFEYAQFEEVYDGNNSKYIFVNEYPVESLDAITINNVEKDVSDFDFGEDGRIIYSNKWPLGDQNIEITYTAGYEAEEMPSDLLQAILLVAIKMYENMSTQKNPGMQAEKIGEHSYTKINPLQPIETEKVKEILSKYINRRIC